MSDWLHLFSLVLLRFPIRRYYPVSFYAGESELVFCLIDS